MEAGIYLGRELTRTERRLCGIAFPTKTNCVRGSDGVYSFGMFGIDRTGLVDFQPLMLRLIKDNGVGYIVCKDQNVLGHGSVSEDAKDYDRINSNSTLTLDAGMMLCEGRVLEVGIGSLYGWDTDDEFRPTPKIALFNDMVKENYSRDPKNLAKYGGNVWAFERLADFFLQRRISVAGLDKALTPLADVYCNFPKRGCAYWFEDAYTLVRHVFSKDQKETGQDAAPAEDHPQPAAAETHPHTTRRQNPAGSTMENRSVRIHAFRSRQRRPSGGDERQKDIDLGDLISSVLGEDRPDITEEVRKSIEEEDGLIPWAYKRDSRIMVKGSDRECAEIFIMCMS